MDAELRDKNLYAEKVLMRLLLHTDESFGNSPCIGDLLPPVSNSTLLGLCGRRGAGIQLKHGCIRSNDFIVTDLGSGIVGACMDIHGQGLVILMDLYRLAPRLYMRPPLIYIWNWASGPLGRPCGAARAAAPWAARA